MLSFAQSRDQLGIGKMKVTIQYQISKQQSQVEHSNKYVQSQLCVTDIVLSQVYAMILHKCFDSGPMQNGFLQVLYTELKKKKTNLEHNVTKVCSLIYALSTCNKYKLPDKVLHTRYVSSPRQTLCAMWISTNS